MTVETNDALERYTISGAGPYAFSFRIFSESDLAVTVIGAGGLPTTLVLDTDYTVPDASVNDEDGGTLSLTSGAAATHAALTLDIRSNTPISQPTGLENQGAFRLQAIEGALDRQTRQLQDVDRRVRGALRLPDYTVTDAALTPLLNWFSKYVYINASGLPEPAAGISNVTLTKSVIAGLLFDQTLAEDAAGVTPTNYAYEPGHTLRYGTNTTPGTTNMAPAVQSAVTVALASGGAMPVLLPAEDLRFDSSVELNDLLASGAFRRSVRIIGAGKHATRIIVRTTGGAFKHTLTQTQGDNRYFARGLELAHFSIIGDGSTPALADGLVLEGAFFPWLHDLHIGGLTRHGIHTPVNVLFANSDAYSCASINADRVTIVSCTGWGIKNQCFSTAYKLQGNYITSNVGGGLYLEGSQHKIDSGSIAGNGASADAASMGIYLVRTADGTPQDCEISHCEIDGNYNYNILTNGMHTHIHHNRINDDATGGSFKAATQIKVAALAGQTADNNLIEFNNFRFTAQGAANVTAVSFDLDSLDGRTVRYNTSNKNSYTSSGVTSGVTTNISFGTNPTSSSSKGNKHYTNDVPRGSTVIGSTTRNLATATSDTVVTGLGFRPTGLMLTGFVPATALFSEGYCDSLLANRGTYFYPTDSTYNDTGSNKALVFRSAVGDLVEIAVTAFSDDGFTLTCTRTGAPTGTATIKYMATI